MSGISEARGGGGALLRIASMFARSGSGTCGAVVTEGAE
jgi:hypothetical protein